MDYVSYTKGRAIVKYIGIGIGHRVHRVATDTFWRTFRADTLFLFLLFPYMYSVISASIILGVNSSLIRVYPFLESRIPLSEPEGISS